MSDNENLVEIGRRSVSKEDGDNWINLTRFQETIAKLIAANTGAY
jgi:hypothetical protein